jgi:hypothetical protein
MTSASANCCRSCYAIRIDKPTPPEQSGGVPPSEGTTMNTRFQRYNPSTMTLRPGEGANRLRHLPRNLLSLCIAAAIRYPGA